MSILVTGGGGFLGSAFASRARDAGHDVVIADRLPGADIALDASDTDAVAAAVAAVKPRAILHLAAGLNDMGQQDPVGCVRLNALGTAAVFAAAEANGVERVIYASSISAVGRAGTHDGDDQRLAPGNVYGATKAFCEHLAQAMSTRTGAPCYLGLRFGYVYGPGRVRGWRDAQSPIDRVAAGERRIDWPDFGHAIDWTWIDDAGEVLLRAVERPLPRCAALNVAGDKRTMADLVAHLKRRVPDLVDTRVPAQTNPAAWSLANDGLAALLGYAPSTTLEQGIDRMLARGDATTAAPHARS